MKQYSALFKKKESIMLVAPFPSLFVKYCQTVNELTDFIETLTEKDNYPCQVYDDADGNKFITCKRRFCEDQIKSITRGKDAHYSVDTLMAVLAKDGFVFLDFETCEMTLFAPVTDYPFAYSDKIDLKFVIDKKKYAKLRHLAIFVKKMFMSIFN